MSLRADNRELGPKRRHGSTSSSWQCFINDAVCSFLSGNDRPMLTKSRNSSSCKLSIPTGVSFVRIEILRLLANNSTRSLAATRSGSSFRPLLSTMGPTAGLLLPTDECRSLPWLSSCCIFCRSSFNCISSAASRSRVSSNRFSKCWYATCRFDRSRFSSATMPFASSKSRRDKSSNSFSTISLACWISDTRSISSTYLSLSTAKSFCSDCTCDDVSSNRFSRTSFCALSSITIFWHLVSLSLSFSSSLWSFDRSRFWASQSLEIESTGVSVRRHSAHLLDSWCSAEEAKICWHGQSVAFPPAAGSGGSGGDDFPSDNGEVALALGDTTRGDETPRGVE